ncbi:hypothetical protein [Ruixingdingia sedimenti]|uniref:Flagellar protein FliT n=1 Tax=Ruixingdingia sedimenti TaxID=3073604 RepID=A0ABU1F752_9RHOB|nr:hypothetical protein [Xinfangfangia sp. LG-4]MDR5652715.1 hypothetical protein [Xinfangfangia sp. LG-4]
MKDPRLVRLAVLAGMIRDHELGQLRARAEAMAQTRAHLAGLATAPPADTADMALMLADLRHQQWAEARRRDLNTTLARQTAEWMTAQDAARAAFGRAEALARLRDGKRR